MAQQLPDNTQTGTQPSRYTENRSPQFVGGGTDPTTGNVNPSSQRQAAVAPPPATPQTRLASVYEPQVPSAGAMLTRAALSAAAPGAGAAIGARLGAGQPVGAAISGGLSDLGNSVRSLVGFGGNAGGGAAGGAGGAAGGTAGAAGAAGASLGSGGGATLGASGAPMSTLGGAAGYGVGSESGELGSTVGAPLSLNAPGLGGASSAAGNVGGDVLGVSGSTLGGAAGAGIGTALVGIATGQQIKQWAPAAAGSAVGFVIGNMILPGIGGFIGSALGGLFCHTAGTMILMADGTRKPIEDIRIGDDVYLGGKVLGRGEVLAQDLYLYRGTVVTGYHAAFSFGRWRRVKDDAGADYCGCGEGSQLVYPLVTEHHLLVCDQYISADFAETDDLDISASERLTRLNANHERNRFLIEAEKLLWPDDERSAAA